MYNMLLVFVPTTQTNAEDNARMNYLDLLSINTGDLYLPMSSVDQEPEAVEDAFQAHNRP